jgi:hypothetical protein
MTSAAQTNAKKAEPAMPREHINRQTRWHEYGRPASPVSSRRRGLLLRASHRTGHAGLASGSLDRFVRMARQVALTPVRGC